MLASERSLTRICPIWLLGWASLCKQAVYGWLDDHAATMGAAIAYYTVFSLAPMLVMVIGVAGLAFGREAAEGALFGELAELIGPESAGAVQTLLRSASSTRSGIVATAIGIGTLIIALVAQHGGRIVKTTGDGVLIEVGSVVGAAQCAMALKFSTTI
jgi:uncharacterized BrkB/YihY/UPF0761 family membrane protein